MVSPEFRGPVLQNELLCSRNCRGMNPLTIATQIREGKGRNSPAFFPPALWMSAVASHWPNPSRSKLAREAGQHCHWSQQHWVGWSGRRQVEESQQGIWPGFDQAWSLSSFPSWSLSSFPALLVKCWAYDLNWAKWNPTCVFSYRSGFLGSSGLRSQAIARSQVTRACM